MRFAALLLLLLFAGFAPAADTVLEKPLTPVSAAGGATASGAAVVPAAAKVVGFIPIVGVIDERQAAYFIRALKAAQERHVTHLVVHMTTPGGELGAGMKMLNAALNVPKDAPRLIAFVDDHSLSAGSLIAYGHDEILVTGKALLGDIGVITMGSDGEIKYLPEKIETVVRSLLRNAAQNRGWDQAKLVKMTARTQELYRFTIDEGPADRNDPEGRRKTRDAYVIQDDLATWLADHPTVKPESKVVVLGDDRLLSYTAREAVDAGMATALVADLDGVYARLGVAKADVVDLSPSETEQMSWTLAGWAPLLASLALLFIFLEFKIPSGGLWLIGAAIIGTAFFVCQFYLDLASYIEVVMILVGLALIIVELLVFPIGGMLAATGGALMVAGLVLAFMPDASQFAPSTDGWSAFLGHALLQSFISVAVVSVGTLAMLAALPHVAVRTGLADAAAIDGTSAGAVEGAAPALAGRHGSARTLLRPGGQVDIDGQLFNAVTADGAFIQPGATVVVVSARFGELVVKAVDEPAGAAGAATGGVA